jgi:hypothetical protein
MQVVSYRHFFCGRSSVLVLSPPPPHSFLQFHLSWSNRNITKEQQTRILILHSFYLDWYRTDTWCTAVMTRWRRKLGWLSVYTCRNFNPETMKGVSPSLAYPHSKGLMRNANITSQCYWISNILIVMALWPTARTRYQWTSSLAMRSRQTEKWIQEMLVNIHFKKIVIVQQTFQNNEDKVYKTILTLVL